MRVFCVGLLLFSVTWAAPTFRPQTEKTEQSCVEEQRPNSGLDLEENNLPDPHPMPWPTSRSASGPAAAGVILEDPRCPWTKKTKTISVFTIWARE
uniref:Matrix extracellular phosphoglycoprotein n=1 Tax=Saimiri boliviensis boliviensis TaxID=39432 RepID=A0A2K6UED4_SAIBB